MSLSVKPLVGGAVKAMQDPDKISIVIAGDFAKRPVMD